MARGLLAQGLQEFVADFAHLQEDEQHVPAGSKHYLSVRKKNKCKGVMPYATSISFFNFLWIQKHDSHILRIKTH